MNKTIFLSSGILSALILISGCNGNMVSAVQTKSPVNNSATADKNDSLGATFVNPVIKTDITAYSPIMSSTIGIGLTGTFTGPKEAKFHWTTDFGDFYSWNPPDFMVKKLGNNIVNNGEKVYWSYDSSMSITKSRDFKINLVIEGLNKTDKALPHAIIKGNVDEKGMANIFSTAN